MTTLKQLRVHAGAHHRHSRDRLGRIRGRGRRDQGRQTVERFHVAAAKVER